MDGSYDPAVTDSYSWSYCPRCGFPLYEVDHFCGGCQLPVAPAPPGSRPPACVALGPRDPYRACWHCGMPCAADRSFCTNCGADLRTTPVVTPNPPVRWYDRQFKNPILSVSLTVLVLQSALLIALIFLWRSNHSVSNGIYLFGIAISMVANIAGASRLAVAGLRRRSSGSAGKSPEGTSPS